MSLDIDRIQALCFDVDGTLSDTDDLFVQRIERLLKPFRFLFPDRDTHRPARRLIMGLETPGNFLIGIPDTLGLDDEIFAVIEWLNRHRPRPMKHFMIVPNVKEMLLALSKQYPMAVVSARNEKSTLLFLDKFKLTSLFHVIVTATTTEHTKPYPHPIIYAAKVMNVDPASCLMVGDTSVDIRAGVSAGAQTVGVLCGFGEEKELRRHGANLILSTTSDLLPVLTGK